MNYPTQEELDQMWHKAFYGITEGRQQVEELFKMAIDWNNAQLAKQEPVARVGDLNEYTASYLLQEGHALIDALYAAPMPAQAPEGWELNDCGDGHIIVRKDGVGGYVSSHNGENIASTILHALAADLLAAAPTPPNAASKTCMDCGTSCDQSDTRICASSGNRSLWSAKNVDTKSAFPDRDSSKPAEQQGMFRKFDVRRVDGSDAPGGKHFGCRYFVLDLNHDAHAAAAMRAYAESSKDTHPQLSAEITAEFGNKQSDDAKDAERYRYWKAKTIIEMSTRGHSVSEEEFDSELDAAIDALKGGE